MKLGFTRTFARTLLSLFALWAAVIHSGCSKSEPEIMPQIPSGIRAENLTVAKILVESAVTHCDGSSMCDGSVGMVVGLKEFGDEYLVERCTGFLVAPDIVATNSHCLDDGIQLGSRCQDQIWLVFPEGPSRPAERLECAEVLSFSDYDKKASFHADYAFFRLAKPSTRPLLKISYEGLPDGLSLQMIKADPTSGVALEGTLLSSQCTVVQRSIDLPSFNDDRRPVATLSGCQIRPGNSGSPMLDSSGSVRAITHARKFKPRNPGELSAEEETISVFATNLACVQAPVGVQSPRQLPAECAVTQNSPAGQAVEFVTEAEAKAVEVAAEAKIIGTAVEIDSRLGWSAVRIDDKDLLPKLVAGSDIGLSGVSFALPKCFRNPESWLSKFHSRLLFWRYKKTAKLQYSAPLWFFDFEIDQLRRMKIESRRDSREFAITVRFSPASLHETGRSFVVASVKGLDGSSHAIASGTLGTCPAE